MTTHTHPYDPDCRLCNGAKIPYRDTWPITSVTGAASFRLLDPDPLAVPDEPLDPDTSTIPDPAAWADTGSGSWLGCGFWLLAFIAGFVIGRFVL